MKSRLTIALLLCSLTAPASQIIRESLSTQLVIAGAVDYGILLPDDYSAQGERLPLLLFLHGAGGDREQLVRFQEQVDEMWASGDLPKMAIVTPSIGTGSIYLDSYDAKNKWETFIMSELLPHLRKTYPVSRDRETTMLSGISVGGFGSLRLGFKYPETFGALAAMEPGAWPGTTWDEVPDRNKIRTAASIANLFGDPFDHERFQRENPASILDNSPQRLANSAIYMEVGDEDGFGFMEGVDFIHRLMWRHNIPHEYRLVRWADHIGSTISERSRDRFRFLARYLSQPTPPEPAREAYRENMSKGHQSRGMKPFGFWPNNTTRAMDTKDGAENNRRALHDSAELRRKRGVVRIADIAYDSKPGVDPKRLSLDVYLCDGLKDAPVVLYVHGGGWVRGDKSRALFKPAKLVPEGYLFASMNYRFRPHVSLSEMAEDVATATVWIRDHARQYGGDPSKLFIMGHSAGAHLVAAVATNEQFMKAAGGSLSDLTGVIPIDTAMYNVPLALKGAAGAQSQAFGDDPAAWTPVSPWHHVASGKGIPPFLLFASDGRDTIPKQIRPLIKKLEASGIEASMHEGKGRAHSPLDTYLGVEGDESTAVLMKFLARHSQ